MRHSHGGRRAHPARRQPGHRQNPAGARPCQLHRHVVQTYPVHPGPAAVRRGRRHLLRPEARRIRIPRRPDLRVHRARRRNQPRLTENTVRTTRSHGRAEGHRRRRHPPGAAAVHGHRHPEPDRTARHLQAAGSADGPFPHQNHHRLSKPRRERQHPETGQRHRPRRHRASGAHRRRRAAHAQHQRNRASRRRDPRIHRATGGSHPPQRTHPSRLLHARRARLDPLRARMGRLRQPRLP